MKLEPGGKPGGEVKFLIGAALTVIGVWMFFDSVYFVTGNGGLISNAIGGGRGRGGGGGRGMIETTSMGIVFVPLFIGVVALFFNARLKWAWGLTGIGILILAIEIVSRFRPAVSAKGTHLFLMIILIAGGLGLMLRGYVEDRKRGDSEK